MLFVIAVGSAWASSKDPHFDYENPIQTEPIRDPQIVKVGKTWYMTGTASPFVEGTSQGPIPGVKLWSSTNLTEWKFVSLLITPSKDHWYKRGFHAPELFPYKGKWYLTFSCSSGESPDSAAAVGLAVADKIAGPYRVLTEDAPLTDGNDATLFQDDDGKVYLFRAGISAIQVDLGDAATIGSAFNVIERGPDSAWDGTGPGGPQVGVEGPSVFKHDHNYYLLYASWGRGYEEGYATAPRITGPWLKYHNNPVYGAQDEDWSRIYKHEYTQAASVPYGQLGHGTPFIGPDGNLWFGCHGYLKGKGQQPHLVITPLTFDHEVINLTATWTPQVIFLPHHFRVHLNDTRLASPDLVKLAAQP
ncbi:glycoside hydrolase family 43 protein [Silvibacterium bohemicum]|uniref:glycoside hydrolase family 43 protein n=1 Tax=Silvibacterium bohemicum TaxID=1577686 RepID=UPI001E4A5159|nr:family 43 glycosylhydrolase [Silvibacterium bohemicum]